ncbi:MAG TPA: glycosyltransferase family 1 protein [Sedimentisphaerales bacterium]|nr:glycosyltransferase family 1 protein [Sedimentisphaerales bacterium]HRS10921.1 glycosyltransferase family 1 protein [Sedimentisphaerales bacterium]HRV47625.1 glycosyltransferase family 1 protein [Sedimentisphaerales bacterium]
MLNITAGGMSGGYRTYLFRLVPRLAGHPEVEALLVGMPQTIEIDEWRERTPSVQWIRLRCALASRGREVGPEARKAIERFAPDVIFIPTARHFTQNGAPVVNMVRNMMPAAVGHSAYPVERLRNWGRLWQMQRAVRRSDRVIAISQFVRDYLIADLGLDQTRVGVVYHGIDPVDECDIRQPVAVSHEWKGRFVFTAGLIYPYRGMEDLIGAWGHLRTGSDLPPLVIAGKIGQGMKRYYRKLVGMVEGKGLAPHIRFVGVLDRGEMAWCYRNCAAFVMTSRVEACPNIALEAMAHGCVCISTDNPPMPEIFGEAARYYRAGAAKQLARHICDVLTLPGNQREGIRYLTVARARRFTWDACCQGTIAELQKAAGRRRIDSGSAE